MVRSVLILTYRASSGADRVADSVVPGVERTLRVRKIIHWALFGVVTRTMPVRPRRTVRLLRPPHKHNINSLPLANPGDQIPAAAGGMRVRKWFHYCPRRNETPCGLVRQQIGIPGRRPGITLNWAANRPPGGQITQALPA